MERIRREGRSEVLIHLLRLFKYQQFCKEFVMKPIHTVFVDHNDDGLKWGIVEVSSSVVMELCFGKVIEVDVPSKRLLRVNGEDVKGIEHAQVLNLSDDGERWEGDVLDNQPYGWGVVYDYENRMAYEGFRIGDVNVCYGTRYYSDVGVIEYKGEWFEGKRWGRGILYNRNGGVVYDGEWMNGEQLGTTATLTEECVSFHNHIEELVVSDCCGYEGSWNVLDLSFVRNLRELKVGDKCFVSVDEVRLIGLNRLESVVVGERSFVTCKTGCFYLRDCEKVRELIVGCYSFSNYSVCEIANVPSLEVIEIGVLEDDNISFESAAFDSGKKLELKSIHRRMSLMHRLAQVEIRSLWLLRVSLLFAGCV